MAGRSPWGRITIWDAAADGDLEKVIQRLESNNYHLDGQDSNGKTGLLLLFPFYTLFHSHSQVDIN